MNDLLRKYIFYAVDLNLYIDTHPNSKEAIEEKKVGYCVRDTKITLDKELLTREQERSNLEDEIKTLKCEYPLSLVNIISCELRLEQLKNEIKTIKDLQIEFGFEKEEKGK